MENLNDIDAKGNSKYAFNSYISLIIEENKKL